MPIIIDDLRFSLRLFWRYPSLALIAVVALAIGIGANTSIFSVVDGVLLRPLPYSQPERLVMMFASTPTAKEAWVSYADFQDWRRGNHSFIDIAAFGGNWAFNLSGSDRPEHVRGGYVSAGLFRLLGVHPLLGRSFLPQEDRPGAAGTAMLSYGLWQRKFGGDPMTESVMLGIAAGALGLLLAYWGTQLVLAAIPYGLPHTQHIAIDGDVLLFTLTVSALTGIVFGLAPAFHGSNVNTQESLKEGARTSGSGRRRTEGAFVAVQIALAVVLLAGAGLMMQSIWRLWQVDPGFDPSHVLTTEIALSPTAAGSASRVRTAYRETLARVAAAPGVQSAAIAASPIPLDGDIFRWDVWAGGGPKPPPDQVSSTLSFITTPGYLRVMGIPLLKGRFFTDRDTPAGDPVVVIDDVLAHHLFPNQDAIGKEVNVDLGGRRRVVGVVGHVKKRSLDSDDKAKVRNELYFPFDQIPDQYMREETAGLYLLIRTTGDPLNVLASVRRAVAGPTNDQPLFAVRTMEQIVSGSLVERRFTMLLLIVFASMALLLAAIGIYGVMSYAVNRRTQELGVRVALGASRSDVLKLVLREGMTLAAIGVAVGLAGALALTRLLATLLYGVRPADPVTLCLVSLTLLGVAFLACYLPARRAAKIDPMAALRYE